MKVYLAAPFFNEEELSVVEKAEHILDSLGLVVFSPRKQEHREAIGTPGWFAETFKMDCKAIDNSNVVVALYHGNYSDTGTAWECGYAYENSKPIILVHMNPDSSNLMMTEAAWANITIDELAAYDFKNLPKKPMDYSKGERF